MKRHMDLIRAILFFAEDPQAAWFAKEIAIDGWGQKDIVDHVGLALEAGFLDGTDESLLRPDGKDFLIEGLTYDGHDFLDKVRSDTTWNQVKEVAKKQGIDFTVDAAIRLASQVVAGLLKIPGAL